MPDYKVEAAKCEDFLKNFVSEHDNTTKYMDILQEIANRKQRVLEIGLDDVVSYFGDGELEGSIRRNTRRYQVLFAEAADASMPLSTQADTSDDVIDVLMRQREQRSEELDRERARPGVEGEVGAAGGGAAGGGAAGGGAGGQDRLPPSLKRRFEVRFTPQTKQEPMKLRQVKAEHIGQLVIMKCIVTRVNDVRPLMQVATYTCDECGFEIYQEVTSASFAPVEQCPSSRCKLTAKPGQLHLQTRGCKFIKYQEVKVQELAEEVPMGSIPRTLDVQFRGELTRTVAPGDIIDVIGIFLPIQYTGFRAMRAGLVANVYLEALGVRQHKKRYSEHVLGADVRARVEAYAQDRDIYSRLAKSIAPEIFGHEDVKKAIMLLQVGGMSRTLGDGMKLRGDMHMCLMGDPGVAKSQLLKYVCKLAPRAVYTTGRGSSGVGLTASVTRDPLTQDMTLEGGALVLADMGVCCIDEFDKMEESDRTAIHEVMEQQTVSIAKAGITTTLNARTSVLAAANPAWGRYDMRKSPEENIALPAALLSRFDLLWLILDRADAQADNDLAQHVLHVHRHQTPPALGFEPLPASDIRSYIAEARNCQPFVPESLADYLAAAYSELRAEEAADEKPTSYTTARTLLSILRMAQALARLRFSTSVCQSDVDEALRLMKMSKVSLSDDASKRSSSDAVSNIYATLRDYIGQQEGTTTLSYTQAVKLVTAKGQSRDLLDACLQEYETLNVWQVDEQKNIVFVN